MNVNYQYNKLFQDTLRGPSSHRRRSSYKRNKSFRASVQLDLSQLTQCDNSLADSAIRSISLHRNSIQHDTIQMTTTIQSEKPIKKSTLMKKSSNLYRQFTWRDENKQIILLDHTKDQSDVILKYLPDTQIFLSKVNQQILQGWIPTLPQEERKIIEKNKKYFPIPRNIPYHEMISGLNIVYGLGKDRRLWPGEEALLMETIRLYLKQIQTNPKLLLHSVTFTLQQIIRLAGLEEIYDHKICMQQLECHWKMMATRFRYSGTPELSKKSWQHWLDQAQLRGHFLNLQNDNLLTQYLLQHKQYD